MSGVGVRCMGDARGRGGKGVRRGGKQSAGGGGALPATDKQGNRTLLRWAQKQTKDLKGGNQKCSSRPSFPMFLFSNCIKERQSHRIKDFKGIQILQQLILTSGRPRYTKYSSVHS